MSDLFGALAIPLVAPAAGESAGDPLLTTTLSFFRAVLNANAVLAWRAAYKAEPNALVVKSVVADDPQSAAFRNDLLPALFLSRESADDPVRIAEDWLIQRSVLRLIWLMPVAVLEKRTLRDAMCNAVSKVLTQAVERNRDPAWVVVGDTDPRAATEGSDFSAYGGWMEFLVGAWKPYTFVLQVTGETSSQSANQPRYVGLSLACKVTERLVEDPTRYPATGPLNLTVKTSDGLSLGVAEVP